MLILYTIWIYTIWDMNFQKKFGKHFSDEFQGHFKVT